MLMCFARVMVRNLRKHHGFNIQTEAAAGLASVSCVLKFCTTYQQGFS
jgi:hypothetical protein